MTRHEQQVLNNQKRLVGEVFNTNRCGSLVVIAYTSCSDVTVRFLATGTEVKTTMGNIKAGRVRDKAANINGVMDMKYDETTIRLYAIWKAMIYRCSGKLSKSRSTYDDCSYSEDFSVFSDFYSWCKSSVGFDIDGWQLDKDVLKRGNRLYAPETCCFIPSELNSLILRSQAIRGALPIGVSYTKHGKFRARLKIGKGVEKHLGTFDSAMEAFSAYKKAKELRIKELAEKWKGSIDQRVYDSLISWEVNIDD